MGLFINHDHHPNVFKNQENVHAPNQGFVKYNYYTELLNEQKKTNMELMRSIAELNSRYGQQEITQKGQWKQIKYQIKDLKKASNIHRMEFESQLVQKLETLDEKSSHLQEIVESENPVTKSILEEINRLSTSNREITDRLKENEASNQALSTQLNEQLDFQKEITEKLSIHEEHQGEVLKRLDKQEALTEKISRQLTHIRSIIFERTNFLAIKLEEGYKLTASHVYNLMQGTNQPLSFSHMHPKKEEQK
jgi:DNA repair ATPase RecN